MTGQVNPHGPSSIQGQSLQGFNLLFLSELAELGKQLGDWDVSSISSIKQSEKEHQKDPSVIAIVPPMMQMNTMDYAMLAKVMSQSGSVSSIGSQEYKTYQDTVTNVLNNWSQNIASIEKMMQQERNSPLHRILEDYKTKVLKNEGVSHPTVFAITAALMVASTYLGSLGNATAVPGVQETTFNIVNGGVNQAITGIAGDMRAELGLLGAIFATGPMFQAAVLTIGTPNNQKGLQFAKNFVAQTVKWITGPEADLFLRSLIGSKVGPEELKNFSSVIKIVLLFNALALYNKAEVGHLTQEEMTEMVKANGTIQFSQEDPRYQLVQLLRRHLDSLKGDPKAQAQAAQVIGSLFKYYDKQPSMDHLADLTKSFEAIYSDLPASQRIPHSAN